jgi:hypothetical protein
MVPDKIECVRFRNEDFLFWSRPHEGLWRGVKPYAAAAKPEENADQGKKEDFCPDTG